MKKNEIIQLANEYKIKYSLIEPNLKYGFEYIEECRDAVFAEKKISLNDFQEKDFERDLEYITDLYKAYEVRFENAKIELDNTLVLESNQSESMSYEELSDKMLTLIEEVGNLAKALKELKKK